MYTLFTRSFSGLLRHPPDHVSGQLRQVRRPLREQADRITGFDFGPCLLPESAASKNLYSLLKWVKGQMNIATVLNRFR